VGTQLTVAADHLTTEPSALTGEVQPVERVSPSSEEGHQIHDRYADLVLKRLARVLIFSTLCLGFLATSASAACAWVLWTRDYKVRPDSKYSFTQATLIALFYARSAWRESEAFEAERKVATNQQALTLLTLMMRHTKTASESFACADMVLEPYKNSPDQKMIGHTADVMAAVYRQHIRLNDQFLDLLRNLPDPSGPTKQADVISTIEVERGKLWDDLTKATTLTLLGLVDQSKTGKDGTLQTLVITRAERKELLGGLVQAFPEAKAPDRPGSPPVTFIAGLYHLFLTKPYKSADE